jgi:hypothetical protein
LAAAVGAAGVAPALASGPSDDASGIEIISASGSSALKNFTTSAYMGYVGGTVTNSGCYSITLDGNTYYSGTSFFDTPNAGSQSNSVGGGVVAGNTGFGATNGGSTSKNSNTYTNTGPGIQFEWHNTGSVEGIIELAEDQLMPITTPNGTTVNDKISRDPSYGNPVVIMDSVNGANTFNGANYTLKNHYLGTMGTNNANSSANTGQAPVQFAISDVVPVQAFSVAGTSSPTNANPGGNGYGMGDTALGAAQKVSNQVLNNFGVAGTQEQLPNATTTLPAVTVNGSTSTAGLSQLISKNVAVAATTFSANPGTGLTAIDKTDAQFLQTSSRLANGLAFNMATRDVNSGTRNVAALNTGLDPSWASGKNDSGNGYNFTNNSAIGTQVQIGPGMTFSNKSSGGGQLLPTIQNNRMAVGTIALSDVLKVATTSYVGSTGNGVANEVRVLDYAATTGGPANDPTTAVTMNTNSNGATGYGAVPIFNTSGTTTAASNALSDNLATNMAASTKAGGAQWIRISAATMATGAYPLIQNEQYVFVNNPSASGSYLGDSNGDVATVTNNVLNSTSAYPAVNTNSPAVGLVTNGFIPTDTMIVQRDGSAGANAGTTGTYANQTGVDGSALVAVANSGGVNTLNLYGSGTVSNPQNSGNSFLSYATGNKNFAVADPSTITTGTNTSYGGAISSTGGAPATNVGSGLNQLANVTITSKNYLFGNFNQTGSRDLASVMAAQNAQAALASSGAGTSLFNTSSSDTSAGTTITYSSVTSAGTAGSTVTGLTKGDLVAMGDMAGRGVFDGESLYDLAYGAAASTGTGQATLTIGGGSNGLNDALRGATLRKNAAMDSMQKNATTAQQADIVAYCGTGQTIGGVATTAANTYNGSTSANKSATSAWSQANAGLNAFNKYDFLRTGIGNLVGIEAGTNTSGQNEQVFANLVKNAYVVNQMGKANSGAGLNGSSLTDQLSASTIVSAALSTTGTAYHQRIQDAIFQDGDTTVDNSRNASDTHSDLVPYLFGTTLTVANAPAAGSVSAGSVNMPGIAGIFDPTKPAFNGLQINAFNSALSDPTAWEASFYPDLVGVVAPADALALIGDFAHNGTFNGLQINAFNSDLSSGTPSGVVQGTPEPASLVMLALGGCMFLRRRNKRA